MVKYIEKYVCPSVTSTEFTGKPAFQFASRKNGVQGTPEGGK
jgi:hypothetical protein